MRLKQVEPVVEEVGGTKFYITPFSAFKAANLTGELASVLAPLVGALVPLVGDNGEDNGLLDVDAGKAAQALSNMSGISGDKMEALMKKLLLGGHIRAVVENDRGEMEPIRLDQDLANEIFCGEVQDMFVLCFYVIRLNFNGFFKKLGGLSGKVESLVEKTQRPIL